MIKKKIFYFAKTTTNIDLTVFCDFPDFKSVLSRIWILKLSATQLKVIINAVIWFR